MFVGIHTMLALQTGVEELAISPEEGDEFMTAAQRVMRHYSVETTQKTLDTVAFIGCAVQIYGTRAAAFYVRTRRGPRDQAQHQTHQVAPGAAHAPPPAPGMTNGHGLGLHIMPEGEAGEGAYG